MAALKIIVEIIYVLVCIALIVLVVMQEGKQAGLGAISGVADTYWGKNKARSVEGKLELFTKICAALFIVLSLILLLNW